MESDRTCGIPECSNSLEGKPFRSKFCSRAHKGLAHSRGIKIPDRGLAPGLVCKCGAPKTRRSSTCVACRGRSHRGENNPNWRGGRKVTDDGYVKLYRPEHPRGPYVFEHILVMEDVLRRPLHPDETVHHKNGVTSDNSVENLELWASSHPSGQRVEDLIEWAKHILNRYDSELVVR